MGCQLTTHRHGWSFSGQHGSGPDFSCDIGVPGGDCPDDAYVIVTGGKAWVYAPGFQASTGTFYQPKTQALHDLTITVFRDDNFVGVRRKEDLNDEIENTYEFVLGENYALPYDFDRYCQLSTPVCDGNTIAHNSFLATIEPPSGGGGGGGGDANFDPIDPVFTFTDGGPITIKSEWPDQTWDIRPHPQIPRPHVAHRRRTSRDGRRNPHRSRAR